MNIRNLLTETDPVIYLIIGLLTIQNSLVVLRHLKTLLM